MWRYINGADIYWFVKCSNHLEFTADVDLLLGNDFPYEDRDTPKSFVPIFV